MSEKRICNVPGCEQPPVGLGLCSKHYWQFRRGKEEVRKEIEPYANKSRNKKPPKKRGKKQATGNRQQATGEAITPSASSATSAAIDTHQQQQTEENNRLIATVTSFATMMGIKRTGETHLGLLYVSPINEKALLLSHEGNLHSVAMNVGEAMEV